MLVRAVAFAIFSLILAPSAFAAGGVGYPLLQFNPVTTDTTSLQRGLRTFVNYCQGCHSAKYMRYQRLSNDLGIPEQIMKDNIMWGSDRMASSMTVAMDSESGQRFFSAAPPDLSLIGRARSPEYLYTYMMSFYEDPSRPIGANNAMLPGSSMPHVLWQLQGIQRGIFKEKAGQQQSQHLELIGLELAQPGSLNESEYADLVADLTNFLVYLGEPVRDQRRRIGFWVILFLLFYAVITWFLYKEYWRDVN
ncbi:MAG: cytochrome c1 [Candidatus Porifericomitaceae bacterium WSBS_2022_MAG_OTU9]